MALRREYLRGLNVPEESIQAILDEHHEGVNQYKTKAEKADELQTALDAANAELQTRDEQINTLQESVGDNDELKNELQKYKDLNAGYDEKFKSQQLNNELLRLIAPRAVNADQVIALMDKSEFKPNESGVYEGLETHVDAFFESNPHFLTNKRAGVTPPNGSAPEPMTREQIMSIKDDDERRNAIKANIKLFN